MSMYAVKPVHRTWDAPDIDENLAQQALHQVETGGGRLLNRGYQAEVYLHRVGERSMVLKLAYGRGVAGWLRRYMLRREAKVYEHLVGVGGLPRCYGFVEGRCLLLEHFDGRPYRRAGIIDRDAFFASLRQMIEVIHEHGIAHGDLKTRDNILVTDDGMPHIVDFGIAMLRKPDGGWLNRWLFEMFRQFDRNAWIKLKYKKHMGAIEAPDLAWHHVTRVERLARRVRATVKLLRR